MRLDGRPSYTLSWRGIGSCGFDGVGDAPPTPAGCAHTDITASSQPAHAVQTMLRTWPPDPVVPPCRARPQPPHGTWPGILATQRCRRNPGRAPPPAYNAGNGSLCHGPADAPVAPSPAPFSLAAAGAGDRARAGAAARLGAGSGAYAG